MENSNVAENAKKERDYPKNAYIGLVKADKKRIFDIADIEDRKNANEVMAQMIIQYLPFREKMSMPSLLSKQFKIGNSKITITETRENLRLSIKETGQEVSSDVDFNKESKDDMLEMLTVLLMFYNRLA